MSVASTMWTLFEPIHTVTYFHPAARERFVAAGLRGFWRGYFAGRSAPLGPVGPAPVIAAYYNFAPRMVARALPEVWTMASPEEALRARAEGAVQALTELLPDTPVTRIEEAAEALEAAVATLEPAGRVLGAANLALPAFDNPYARLHQAATTLREHRGDGHVAGLVAAGIGPLDVVALRIALGDLSWAIMQPARGWTDEEYAAARDRLRTRGWIDGAGAATADGTESFMVVERATNRIAEAPWIALGPARVQRVRELLAPMAEAGRSVVPPDSPVGRPRAMV